MYLNMYLNMYFFLPILGYFNSKKYINNSLFFYIIYLIYLIKKNNEFISNHKFNNINFNYYINDYINNYRNDLPN